MRSYLRSLTVAGVVERQKTARGNTGDYQLTSAGLDLLSVARTLDGWLARAPEDRRLTLGTPEAKNAIGALADGWSSGMVRALAARPMSLTELDNIIASVSYPALERRLTAMRLLGMVRATPTAGRSTPYTITPWLRGAIAPLAAATFWEHRHRADQAPPIMKRDIEAAFLLALPLIRLPGAPSGVCRLAVRMAKTRESDALVGVTAVVNDGTVVSCVTDVGGSADAWAHGLPSAWISAIADHDARRLELGGRGSLASTLVEEINRELRLS